MNPESQVLVSQQGSAVPPHGKQIPLQIRPASQSVPSQQGIPKVPHIVVVASASEMKWGLTLNATTIPTTLPMASARMPVPP
jgi:hypothetical protein